MFFDFVRNIISSFNLSKLNLLAILISKMYISACGFICLFSFKEFTHKGFTKV